MPDLSSVEKLSPVRRAYLGAGETSFPLAFWNPNNSKRRDKMIHPDPVTKLLKIKQDLFSFSGLIIFSIIAP